MFGDAPHVLIDHYQGYTYIGKKTLKFYVYSLKIPIGSVELWGT